MSTKGYELADVIEYFGQSYVEKHHPNSYQLRVLGALTACRTKAMGGHKYVCDCCGKSKIAYNSCRNRHCPMCQGAKQAFWVEDRLNNAFPVKHYHIVFTVPESLNNICMLNNQWFYNLMFECVWKTLQGFGYTHFGAESGAICLLHSWGQNLSLHPHIHCIVPALGYSLKGRLKHIGKSGKYLFPVIKLSLKFKGMFMAAVKKKLIKQELLKEHQKAIDDAYSKPWVVHCEPSLGKPDNVVKYLGQYTHRVAISNRRIINIDNTHVYFSMKDYRQNSQLKVTSLPGEEFLRRFVLHILPKGFVKIRHYGIYSVRFRSTIFKLAEKTCSIQPQESNTERISRLMNRDIGACQHCKKGRMIIAEIIPRSRSPGFLVLPPQIQLNH
ncbi:MAG: IS91 family transposase [Bacteroidales bacterium]|nr:IS91 family transposase [Bacteroidales bacterium]